MWCLGILVVILTNFGLPSEAKVSLPFGEESYRPSAESQVACTVTNENFLGWFKKDAKIKVFAKKEDIKGELGVYSQNGSLASEKIYYLYLPVNLPLTAVGGEYQCRGSLNNADVRIVMRFNVDNLDENQQLHIGENGTIVVGALSYPLSVFKWKKDSVPIVFQAGGRLQQQDDGNIQFSNVLKSDAGIYEVEINWESRTTANKKITVTGVEKPKFLSSPKPAKFIGIPGYDYKFCFNVSGLPTPTLQWFKSTVQFDITNSRYSITGNCINIAKLEQMDVAPYKCTAKNSAGEASSVVEIERLGVNPTLNPFAQNTYKANKGDQFELKCSGQGDPTPTLVWSRDGMIISSSKNESVLKIDKVSGKDEGNYTCTIKNGLIYQGKEITISQTMSFLAITKPSINDVKSTLKVYSYIGYPKKIPVRCFFFGVPTPSVTMHRNGGTLANGMGFAVHEIQTKSAKDFGDYNCTGQNDHGSSSHTIQVLFASVPGKPTDLTAIMTCKSITLTWKPPQSNGNMPIRNYVFSYNMTTKRNIDERIRKYRLPYLFAPKTTYKLNLTARNLVGVGPAALMDVTTKPYCKPSAPGIYNLKRKELGPIIVVKWNPPQDDGFDSEIIYRVYWRPKKSSPTNWKVSEDLNKTAREFQIPEEFKPGNYEFKVTAANKAGESRPDSRAVEISIREKPPVANKRTGGLSKGIIAGIVIAILLIVLITIDLFCCFFNSCGVIFCCQRACCAKKYDVDGNKDKEMEKFNKNPPPENV